MPVGKFVARKKSSWAYDVTLDGRKLEHVKGISIERSVGKSACEVTVTFIADVEVIDDRIDEESSAFDALTAIRQRVADIARTVDEYLDRP